MPPLASRIVRALASSTTALRNRDVRRVVVAFFVYNIVELGAWTAILIYAYEATGPVSVGIVAVLQLLPSAAIAPLLAGIADRFRRSRVLVGWYLAQAAAVGAVGFAILLGLPPFLVYGISTLATIALTQTRPVQGALLPELADTPAELTASNALAIIGEGVGAMVGPLAVGILLMVAPIGTAFVACGLLLVGAGLLLLGLHRHDAAIEAPAEPAAAKSGEAADPFAGLREVARDRDLVVVMALLTGRLVIYGGLEVLIVLLAIELLGVGDSGAGFLMAPLGVGTIVGGAAAFGFAGRRRLAPWLAVGALIIGIPVALIGLSPAASSAAVLLTISGIGLAILDVAGQTLLQRITPDHVRARVFGVLEGLLLVGEAIGSIIIGPLAVALGLETAAVLLGLLLPALAALTVARFTSIDHRVAIPERELAALGGIPLFAPLSAAALEPIARHLVRLSVTAGEVVIREGDVGDRWYLVDEGRLRVTSAGRTLRELAPGDAFGEIALLHDIPRTATVISLTDCSLWALERDEFLAAVTPTPAVLAEAERLAANR